MRFTYTATKDGKTIQGSAEAANQEALVAMLARQDAVPVVIKVESDKSKKIRGKVKSKELVVFTRQLSTMVSAGVPLTRSMATLQAQAEGKAFKAIISAVSKDIEGGIALADALEKYPDVFSEIYVNMVRAGEAGGILDEILKRLASQVEQDASMRKKIKAAMTYPIAILGITVVAFFGITIFVLPKIGKIIKDMSGPDASLPIYTEIMLSSSSIMQKYWFIIIAVLFGAVYMLRRYIKTPQGKYKFHALLLRIPIINGIITKIAIARFARTFASLMGAGVGVLDALEVTGGAIGNKVIEEELREAAKQVKNGKQLSEPLSQSKNFPPIVSQMLAIGEETGQIDTILIKVADFYEEEVSTVIDSLSSIIEPLMIVVLGGMVGMIAASVMGPISSLSQNIGTN
jgi:type IV pilus assembly protein PilC